MACARRIAHIQAHTDLQDGLQRLPILEHKLLAECKEWHEALSTRALPAICLEGADRLYYSACIDHLDGSHVYTQTILDCVAILAWYGWYGLTAPILEVIALTKYAFRASEGHKDDAHETRLAQAILDAPQVQRIAAIEIDGVVANSDERFSLARKGGDGANKNEAYDWSIAFDPAHVALDILIDGAVEAIEWLISQSHRIVYVTSRPESMREATLAWLAQHSLDGFELLMKPEEERYLPTWLWKAKEIAKLAARAERVLFIDDDARNREAVEGFDNVETQAAL